MEMRISLNDADNAKAVDVAVKSGHTSKRRAVLEVFRENVDEHLRRLRDRSQKRKSRKP